MSSRKMRETHARETHSTSLKSHSCPADAWIFVDRTCHDMPRRAWSEATSFHLTLKLETQRTVSKRRRVCSADWRCLHKSKSSTKCKAEVGGAPPWSPGISVKHSLRSQTGCRLCAPWCLVIDSGTGRRAGLGHMPNARHNVVVTRTQPVVASSCRSGIPSL